jgi:NAD+ synthase (glutamine-hydrolysing)
MDWVNNERNILAAIEQARVNGVKILCLPELCITGYGCEDLFLSEWIATQAQQVLVSIVSHTHDITVNVGLPIRLNGHTYNGSCVISNRKILGITLKQNLPRDGVHYEPRWFLPWRKNEITEIQIAGQRVQAGDLVYDAESIRMGIEICEDGWSKDKRPGYEFAKRGVQVILNPSASHFAMGKSLNREQEVVLDGSLKFNCVYVFTNLLGNEAGRMIYDGDILIAQRGKLLAQNQRLSFLPTNLVSTVIDVDEPDQSEAQLLHDTKDRMEELTKAASLGLYDYLRKSKSQGFVLSLSGGADSSTCATLVAEMVKRASAAVGWPAFQQALRLPETITSEGDAMHHLLATAYQSSQNSSEETLKAAQTLAESIGARFFHWSIQEEVDTYTEKLEAAIGRKLAWQTDDITLQNIQARARSPIIWMLANTRNSILLTTSNRSEGDVGYTTMDGDSSGSLAPIAGISKTTILEWLKWAEEKLGYTGLQAVNQLQPTAELRPSDKHQTDEDDLMPYAVLVTIERHAILERRDPVGVYEQMKENFADRALLKTYIRKFFRLWAINQWKRERFAPSFHLDDLNVDPRTWCRFPILSSGFDHELAALEKAS